MSAKRRPKRRKTAPPPAAKKPSKPTEPKKSKNAANSPAFQPEKTANGGGSDAFQPPSSPSTQPSQPAASTSGAAFRFFDAFAVGASRLKTPKFVSTTFNAFFRASARLFDGSPRPKTPRQEADDREARFVAGIAALAFAVGVVFFLAGKASRRLDPPSTPNAATIPTPQKLADAVAAEVVKARSNATQRRAVVETSVKTASNAADSNVPSDFNAVRAADSSAKTDSSAETLAFVVNLNSASKAELANLPRVGEKLAERIVERREELGGFRSVDDLLGVKGIGEKTLDKMRPFCVVAPLDDAE
ncbi:MAG: helix-hairpin-helix domain-containing protein [Thermoguttaceae bacterium]|nr:helix-hairpin-helix domain-containing protein [Thermoguttaceae bacterium]MBR4103746.1 helix-hairpin-helix domain-containing protein [Thermoguttaceae bacterium]